MPEEASAEIKEKVREGVQKVIGGFRRPRDQLVAARYLATMAWLTVASGLADQVIVNHRALHPDQTYGETAAELRIHPSTVNRAVVRNNRRA